MGGATGSWGLIDGQRKRGRQAGFVGRALLAMVMAITVLVVPAGVSGPTAEAVEDTVGSEFWVAFKENFSTQGLALFISGESSGSGSVTGPGLAPIPFSVTPGGVTEVAIPMSRELTAATTVESKGVKVSADVEVSVVGYSDGNFSTDAFLALPVDALGSDYVVLDAPNDSVNVVDRAQFAVVGTSDGTEVTIELSSPVSGRSVGVPFVVVLDEGETYLVQSSGSGTASLSGSTIASSAPVAVFAGNLCTTLPLDANVGFCDHNVEQLPPVDRWGSTFVTAPLAERSLGDTFGFVAAEDDTAVFVNGGLAAVLDRGEAEFVVLDDVLEWSSSKPILLAQYSNSIRYDNASNGDPFMMLVAPTEQFLSSYTFATVQDGVEVDFVNVVVPTAAVGTVRVDGNLVDQSLFEETATFGLSVGVVPVSSGTHTVDAAVDFGLASYGFGLDVSYGYPGGFGQRVVSEIDRWQEGGPILSQSTAELYPQSGIDQAADASRVAYVEDRGTELAVMVATTPPVGFGGYSTLVDVVPRLGGVTIQTVRQVRLSGDGSTVYFTVAATTAGPGGQSTTATKMFRAPVGGVVEEVDLSAVNPSSIGTLFDVDESGGLAVFTGRAADSGAFGLYQYLASSGSVSLIDDALPGAAFSDPSISGDGRWVSFSSTGNLDGLAGDDDLDPDIFVLDRNSPGLAPFRVSVSPDGAAASNEGASTGALNAAPAISDDGRFVAFVSTADNLVDRPLLRPTVLVHDRNSDDDDILDEAGETSTTQASPTDAVETQFRPSISNDGLRVAWVGRTATTGELQFQVADRANELVSFSLRSTFRRPLVVESVVDPGASTLGQVSGNGGAYALVSRDDAQRHRLYRGEVNRPSSRFPDVPHQVLGMPRVYRPVVSDPVDVGSGALVAHAVDLPAPAGSPLLTFARSYDSGRWFEGVLGLGWVTNWDEWLDISDRDALAYVTEYGRSFDFQRTDDDSFARPPELLADLFETVDGFEIRWFNGNVTTFDANGTLSARRMATGPSYTVERNAGGLIDRVVADTGASLQFQYVTDGDGDVRLARVAASDGRAVDYTFDNSSQPTAGLLVAVQAPDGGTVYEHDAAGRIDREIDDAGVVMHTTEYDEATDRVVRQTLATGEVTEFLYADDLLTTTVTDVVSGDIVVYAFDQAGRVVSITDPDGNVTLSDWNVDGLPAGSTDRLGHAPVATYDANGNVTSLTDPVRGATSYGYDSLNRVVSVTEPTGAVTTMTYEGIERIPSTVTDGLGNTTTFTIDDGLATHLVDADGVTTAYGYDDQRRMTSMTNGLGFSWSYEYDAVGRQTGSTTPLGFVTSRTFDDAGRMLSSTAADGGVTSYVYDADGRVLSTTDPVGAVTANSYDPVTGLLSSTTDPEGRVTTYTYNELAELVAVEANDGGVSETDYGTLGRVTATRDALGRETTYAYDANGNRTEVVAPDGGVTRTEFDTAGRVAALEDPIGRRTTHSYDEFGRLVSVTQPDGTQMSYTYDLLGRQVETIAPDGGVTATLFTPAGRTASVTDPENGVTSYAYDAAGQVAAVTDPNGFVTSFDYDPDGRRTAVITPEGLVTNWEYDPVGRITKIIDPAGVELTRTYTLRGELATEQREGDGVVNYTYNADGTMSSVADALGNTTTFTYDAAGRQATRVDATGAVEVMEYNTAGELVAQVDRLGQRTEIAYDANGRIATVADPSGRTTDHGYDVAGQLLDRSFGDGTTISYTYDDLGRRLSMDDPTGVTTYSYDVNGRPVEVAAPNGTLGYDYDLAGRRTGLTYPDGTTVTYDYDPAGRLVGLMDPNTGDVDYTLDDDGRLVLTELPNGETREFEFVNGQMIRHQDHGRVTDLTYDESGRIATLAGAQNHTYTYDQAGQLLQAAQDEGTYAYTYGTRGEITSISDPDRSRTFTHNANVEIATIVDNNGDTGSVVYDEAGRMVEHNDPNGTVTGYTYDARGLLVETVITTPGDGGGGPGPDPCAGLTATITGTDGDDVIQGTWQDDVIFGLGGNDVINGASGSDIICGGDGDDTINGQSQDDTIYAGAGDDTVNGDSGADTIDGGPGNDVLNGQSQDDVIQGGDGDDEVNGDSGADTLDGGNGDDVVDGSWQTDSCDDAEQAISCETITFDGELGDTGGGPGSPILCNGLVPTIVGTDGDDVIDGTWQDDVIVALGGNDIINGGSGADTICGGPGNDVISGQSQVDVIAGEAGNDTINGNSGNDVIDGGEGDDTLNGQSQDDQIQGGPGNDTLNGGPGNDALDGGPGDDAIDGSWGSDSCTAENEIGCEQEGDGAAILAGVSEETAIAAPGELAEGRVVDGDGRLIGLEVVEDGGETSSMTIAWDRFVGPPQVLILRENTEVRVSLLGHIRETVGDQFTAYDALGNLHASSSDETEAPYGSPTSPTSVEFGYRGELETPTSIYLRARDLTPEVAGFARTDPLEGVVGSSVLATPYHYADNDPINRDDPLGLRTRDGAFTFEVSAESVALAAVTSQLDGLAFEPPCAPGGVGMTDSNGVDYIECFTDRKLTWGDRAQLGFRTAGRFALDYGVSFIPGADCVKAANGLFTAADTSGFDIGGCLLDAAGVGLGFVAKRADDVAEVRVVGQHRAPRVTRGACSFDGKTHVLLADGMTTQIEDVRVGDWVLAEDPESGERGARRVTHRWVHEDTLLDLVVADATVVTTEDHPFWNVTDNDWQRADELDSGDLLRTADGGVVPVGGVVDGSETLGTAHNLEVDGLHTYFVVVGQNPVLVHNQNTCGWINVHDLPAVEQVNLADTLNRINTRNQPSGKLGENWGAVFENRVQPGQTLPSLPGRSGPTSPFREYRVAPPPGQKHPGPYRVVVDTSTGATYYSWTHYGDRADPAFVRIS